MGNLRKPLLGIIISILSCSLIISASYLQPAKTEIVPLDATYTVSFTTDGGGLGSLTNPSGNQTYSAGQQISINAIADSGYSFSFWSAKPSNQVTFGNSNSASTTATINGNATITATFTQNSYALSAITVGSGSVSKSPNQASYLYGTIVNLTAAPAAGWSFSSWIGDLTGSANPATVIVTKDMSVTATFTQITYQVTFSTSGSGTVSPSGVQTYAAGSMVSITASPSAGYSFASWTASPSSSVTFGNANAASTNATISGNATITATFTQITYQVTFAVSGSGSTSPTGTQIYLPSQVLSIFASPSAGFSFSSWSATPSDAITFANSISASTTATVNANCTITATFTQIPPTPSPAQNQSPTNTPQPTSTPAHQPTPTPQVFTTPVPSSMVIPATTADGSSVNLTIRGNGASSTISSATIKTDASNSTTTITLAITGQSATDGLSNITIPKQAVPFGTTPTVYVNNDIAQNQSYAQDAKNFYVSYKTYSKTYELLIIFVALSSSTGFPTWVFLTVILVITLSVAIVLSRKKIKKHLTANYDNYSEYFSK